MEIQIKFTSTEPLSPILKKYGEFVYTFVFEGSIFNAYHTITNEAPLSYQKANYFIRDIQLNEGIFPEFKIIYDGLEYNSSENNLNGVRAMILKYIHSSNTSVVFDDLNVKLLPIDLIKYLGDDFDMGFVSTVDGETTEFNFKSYDPDQKSILIHVVNSETQEKTSELNLSIDSEDIPFDDLLSISKAICIKNLL